MALALRDVVDRRQVDQHLGLRLGDHALDGREVADVGAEQGEAAFFLTREPQPAVPQVVEHGNLVLAVQPTRKGAADVSISTSDQNPHVLHSSGDPAGPEASPLRPGRG